jgi:hypothetical protein
MDGFPNIGTFSAASASYPDVTPGTPTTSAAPAPPAQNTAPAKPVQSPSTQTPPVFSQAIDDAPSPSPAAIVADTKQLPLAVQYAPSGVPRFVADERAAGTAKFDRSA